MDSIFSLDGIFISAFEFSDEESTFVVGGKSNCDDRMPPWVKEGVLGFNKEDLILIEREYPGLTKIIQVVEQNRNEVESFTDEGQSADSSCEILTSNELFNCKECSKAFVTSQKLKKHTKRCV